MATTKTIIARAGNCVIEQGDVDLCQLVTAIPTGQSESEDLLLAKKADGTCALVPVDAGQDLCTQISSLGSTTYTSTDRFVVRQNDGTCTTVSLPEADTCAALTSMDTLPMSSLNSVIGITPDGDCASFAWQGFDLCTNIETLPEGEIATGDTVVMHSTNNGCYRTELPSSGSTFEVSQELPPSIDTGVLPTLIVGGNNALLSNPSVYLTTTVTIEGEDVQVLIPAYRPAIIFTPQV